MFYSAFYNNFRLSLLVAMFSLSSALLLAQAPKMYFIVPSDQSTYLTNVDYQYNRSEFHQFIISDTTGIDTIQKPVSKTTATLTAEIQVTNVDTTEQKPISTETTAQLADKTKTKPVAIETPVNVPFFTDSVCIDLAFDTVSVIEISEKYVEIEYSIINKGTAPAPIFGTQRSVKDNVAIHFYFSGTPRLTRGSILAEGIYLTEGLRETKGMLAPNAVYKGKFKLPLEKKNRFYGVIILQLDAFDVLPHECDETNNIYPIIPKWY